MAMDNENKPFFLTYPASAASISTKIGNKTFPFTLYKMPQCSFKIYNLDKYISSIKATSLKEGYKKGCRIITRLMKKAAL